MVALGARWSSIHVMENLGAFDDLWATGGTAVVDAEGLTFGVHVRPAPCGEWLMVAMSNLIGRAAGSLPSIEPLVWLGDFPGHLLSICDPTLYLDEGIEVGAFIGDRARDPIPGVLAIARRAAERLGVTRERVIFWGVSGGGFGAAMAAMRSGGQAISINTQESLSALRHWPVAKEVARVFDPAASTRAALEGSPLRTSLLAARAHALPGYRLLFAQNADDPSHWDRHYGAMCSAYGVMQAGGESRCGAFAAMPYSSPEGHGFPPVDINRQILDAAMGFFAPAASTRKVA
jgi:hypothetical protein